MTTNTAPQDRTPRVLVAAVFWVLVSIVVTAATGLSQGMTEARSALLGGGIVVAFFVFGAVVVGTAARLVPGTAVMIAMVTYTLQVVLVGLVFAALTDSSAFDSALSAGWLAAGLIVGTFAWMAGQLVTTLRTPIAPWEGPVSTDDADAAPGAGSGREVDAA
ncbi:MAG: hypothetical protein ACJ72L_21120 [Marmoricola sp.]